MVVRRARRFHVHRSRHERQTERARATPRSVEAGMAAAPDGTGVGRAQRLGPENGEARGGNGRPDVVVRSGPHEGMSRVDPQRQRRRTCAGKRGSRARLRQSRGRRQHGRPIGVPATVTRGARSPSVMGGVVVTTRGGSGRRRVPGAGAAAKRGGHHAEQHHSQGERHVRRSDARSPRDAAPDEHAVRMRAPHRERKSGPQSGRGSPPAPKRAPRSARPALASRR